MFFLPRFLHVFSRLNESPYRPLCRDTKKLYIHRRAMAISPAFGLVSLENYMKIFSYSYMVYSGCGVHDRERPMREALACAGFWVLCISGTRALSKLLMNIWVKCWLGWKRRRPHSSYLYIAKNIVSKCCWALGTHRTLLRCEAWGGQDLIFLRNCEKSFGTSVRWM